MKNILLIFVIFGVLCAVAVVKAEKFEWIAAKDFSSEELANLTEQQEHDLLLKQLSKRNTYTVAVALSAELVAKAIGNDFYGFIADEKINAENNVIVRAAFDCFTKIQYQDQVEKLLHSSIKSAAASINETGSISNAFLKLCSKIDEGLKNEAVYTAAKEVYEKQAHAVPNKIYHYGIPKSEPYFRKAFAELASEPKMKRLSVHLTYSFFVTPEDVVTSKSILELSKLPGKLEPVQTIYEKSVNEVTSLVKDLSLADVNLDFPLNINLRYLKPILSEKLLSKINENEDLKKYFEPIHKRIHDEILEPTIAPTSSS